MQATLSHWVADVSRLRNKHKWLLFITVPKLLQIYKAVLQYIACEEKEIDESDEDRTEEQEETKESEDDKSLFCETEQEKEELVNTLVTELMHLIPNHVDARARLKENILVRTLLT